MSRKDKSSPHEKHSFNAVTMRAALVAILIIILLSMTGIFYLAYASLQKIAEEVSQTQAQAEASDARVQNLIILQKQLEDNSLAFDRAQQIVAESKSYQYQNQIINDLTHYADQAGLSITSFTFQDEAVAKSPSSTQSTSTTTDASSTNSSEASSDSDNTAVPTPSSSLKSTQVSIQLSESVSYQSLLHFLHLIEQNLTRMQVSGVSMAKGDTADTVGVQTLTIEVYIR